jgi:hypothetical protein
VEGPAVGCRMTSRGILQENRRLAARSTRQLAFGQVLSAGGAPSGHSDHVRTRDVGGKRLTAAFGTSQPRRLGCSQEASTGPLPRPLRPANA